jgi:hypothetical protein
LKKAGEARLHKLEKFVFFGASTSDHDMREERIFCQTRPQLKTLGGIEGRRRICQTQEFEAGLENRQGR